MHRNHNILKVVWKRCLAAILFHALYDGM